MDSARRARQSAAMPDTSQPPQAPTPLRDIDPLRAKGGFADLVGYELVRWEEDLAEVSLTIAAHHLNRGGAMHGGVLTTLVDTACGYCGTYSPEGAPPRRAVTLTLTTSFVGAGRLGDRLTARATRSGGGKSVFFADCTVTDESGRVVGTGQGTFKYLAPR